MTRGGGHRVALGSSGRDSSAFRAFLVSALLLGLGGSAVALANDLIPGDDGTVPGYPSVIGELVQVAGHDAPDTPDALDRVDFLRLRPKKSHREGIVDAVILGQPGFSSTPGMWLQTSAQLVEKAAQRKCTHTDENGRESRRDCVLEVWIVDRRGSQVEDTIGIETAWRLGEPRAAVRYYYGEDVYTDRGTIPLPPEGNYDRLLGGRGATFEPLTQKDLGFAWDWGFETMAADVEKLLDLIEQQAGTRNVFLAGHSQGGGFVANWAGRRTGNGRRGGERLAGLIFLDGGPSIGRDPAPDAAAIAAQTEAALKLRDGSEPVFGASLAGITLGTGMGVRSAIQGLFYLLEPDEESILAPAVSSHPAALCFVQGYHLPKDLCGGIGLRLTNRAHAGFSFDDDPIPGTFLQTPVITMLGIRAGHLDFSPREGTAELCAGEGPNGRRPPCPPDAKQIDPNRVYDWLDGGGKGKAGDDGEGNGWVFMNGKFDDRLVRSGPNPSSVVAYMQQTGYSPRRTNIQPVEVELAESGRTTIDSRVLNGITWYQSRRYDSDSGFLGRYQKIQFESGVVAHDIDKTVIRSPVYVAARRAMENPFPKVVDYTAIGPSGTSQSDRARELSAIAPEIESSLYGHTDFMAADDSIGNGKPGEPGTNLVSNTLVDWILARARGEARVPTSKELGVEEWPLRDHPAGGNR